MPYFTITDFAAGMDVRRVSLTAPPGTLRVLRNGHITPGGEIEKRSAFGLVKTMPATTRGLVSCNGKLYAFTTMSQFDIDRINPVPRENSTAYRVGQTITVQSNAGRMFQCTTAGTSAATEPAAYFTALDAASITDGTAVFFASTPPGWGVITDDTGTHPVDTIRANSHAYVVGDVFKVSSNPNLLFTCATAGTSAAAEPNNALPEGKYTITAEYNGDGTFLGCTSQTLTQVVGPTQPGTRTTLTASKNPVDTTDTIDLNAVVSVSTGTGTVTGTVTFYNGTTVLDQPVVLPSGSNTAKLSISISAVGTPGEYVITAVYSGDGVFPGSTSQSLTLVVGPAQNTTRLTVGANANPATAGEELTLTAQLTVAQGSGIPTGTILFKKDGVALGGPVPIVKNSASYHASGYATAIAGAEVTDGTAVFVATVPTPSAPPMFPLKTEPTSKWDVGLMPLETTELFQIIDYDLYKNQVFVTAWLDQVSGIVGRYYDGKHVPLADGYFVKTHKQKIYSASGTNVFFSNLNDPLNWDPNNVMNLATEDSDMSDIQALEVYYDKLAVMSRTATQLWIMDQDPLKSQYQQTLRDAGTVAWRSVLQYGSGDVMYVAPSGVRSLRARNSSLAAAVSDIGSPLDPIMQDLFRTMGDVWMSAVISILQPVTGRFWIILPDRIFILSAFPGPKITAWAQYDASYMDGNGDQQFFQIVAAVQYQNQIVLRDTNNNVWAYGGTDSAGPVFDMTPVELVFPFHSGEQPATYKTLQAIDSAATSKWEVSLALNPDDETIEDFVGLIDGQTFTKGDFRIDGRATHMSLRLRCYEDGPATVSNLIVHYALGESRGAGI